MTTTLNGPSDPPASMETHRRPESPGFLSAYPGYESTAMLDRLRAIEYSYLDVGEHVYLDYTGAGLPAQAQLDAHAERIRGGCWGNPHSQSPTSAAATELIERARSAVLAHFNASSEEYAAVFTPNASGACRLVGEAYPFNPRTRLVLTYDNHNSVNGIREFARGRGARHPLRAVRLARPPGGRWRHAPGPDPAQAGPARRGLASGARRCGPLGRSGLARRAAAVAGPGAVREAERMVDSPADGAWSADAGCSPTRRRAISAECSIPCTG